MDQLVLDSSLCSVIVVTGGDGRVTVAQMLFLMLEAAGKKTFLCEDGVVEMNSLEMDLKTKDGAQSFLSTLEKDTYVVVECSPEDCEKVFLGPANVVVVGDVAGDESIAALVSILKRQQAENFCVTSADRSTAELLESSTVARKFPVSKTKSLPQGAHIEGPVVIFCAPGMCQMVANTSKVLLKGVDDSENILATAAAARLLDVPTPSIQKILYSFEGEEQEAEE